MRIVIAEDAVLLRAGLTRLLAEAGEDIVAAVGDADALIEAVERHQPDLAIVDVRMPPTHTDDGLRAGLHREGASQIYVSPGTGYWGPPMRIGTTSEITRVVLTAA
jgi:DNA-binding NarL/FixJ family response regulator